MSVSGHRKTLGRHDRGRTGQNLEPWHDADPVKNNILLDMCWCM